jgi:hypothetical protein
LVDALSPSSDDMTTTRLVSIPPNRKRVRRAPYDEDEDVDNNVEMNGRSVETEGTTKRLRMEVAQRDQMILQMKQELDRLRQLLGSLPQIMYQPIQDSARPG